MKKYIILLTVIAFLFQSLSGCGLKTKQGSQDFGYFKTQISMSVNLAEYLNQCAFNRDTEFNLLLSRLKNDQENAGNNFLKFLDAANRQKIDLKKYFNVAAANNEAVINQLKNILSDNLKQDSITFYNRMLVSGAEDIKIEISNQSNIEIQLLIDTTRSPLNKIFQALLDTSRVEFRVIRSAKETFNLMKSIDSVLTSENNIKIQSDSIDSEQKTLESFEDLHPLFFIAIVDPFSDIDSTLDVFIKKSNKKTFKSYMNDPQVKKIIPDTLEFLVSTIPTLQIEEENVFNVYCVNKQPSFYGNLFEDYNYEINDDSSSGYLSFKLTSDEIGELNQIVKSIESNLFLIKHVNMVYFSPLKISLIDSLYFRLDGFLDLREVDYLKTILICGRKTLPYKIVFNSIKEVD